MKGSLPSVSSMERLIFIQRWVRRLISFVFFLCLVGLSSVVMRDTRKVEHFPSVTEYESSQQALLSNELAKLTDERVRQNGTAQDLKLKLNQQRQQVASTENEFNNWTSLRKNTQSAEHDKELQGHIAKLDQLRATERDLVNSQAQAEQRLGSISQAITQKQQQLSQLQQEAGRKVSTKTQELNLKIFWYRLLIVLPILATGVYALVKWRHHAYSPLVWGYAWFGVYAFFFGLYPYLPDFGGYVRYGIGVILSGLGGVYIIRNFGRFMDQKKEELTKNKEVRAKEIDSDNAVIALKKKVCPSCGNDFTLLGDNTKFCSHCGLELFRTCECGKSNFALFKYCASCAKPITKDIHAE